MKFQRCCAMKGFTENWKYRYTTMSTFMSKRTTSVGPSDIKGKFLLKASIKMFVIALSFTFLHFYILP